ncbi:hypothetical protein FRC06_004473 [Ceratobasidium sp. 370]|nr:hypothetical protein FRC06_004473 [Ceratobasidium sp. 370]
MVPAIGYGWPDFILALILPANPLFDIHESETHILAHLTKAKDAKGDASIELVSYTQLGLSFVLDITAVKHVVGRVETQGVKPSGSLQSTVFIESDDPIDFDFDDLTTTRLPLPVPDVDDHLEGNAFAPPSFMHQNTAD